MDIEIFRIVLTDDDEADRVLFEEALKRVPLSVQLTALSGGEQLLQYLSANTQALPHAVFLDLNMPRVNGFECLKEIKSNEKLRHLPIIICSTSGDNSSVEKTFCDGAHLYIVKPSDFANLITTIHEALVLLSEPIVQLPKERFVLNKNKNTKW